METGFSIEKCKLGFIYALPFGEGEPLAVGEVNKKRLRQTSSDSKMLLRHIFEPPSPKGKARRLRR